MEEEYRARLTGNCYLQSAGVGKAAFEYVSSTTPGVLCEGIKEEDCTFELIVTVRLGRNLSLPE